MTEDRFHRIEVKLDRLTDVVADVARTGAQVTALLENHNALATRVDNLHNEIYGKGGIYHAMQKNQWTIGLITFFGTMIATGAMSLIVFYLRGLL